MFVKLLSGELIHLDLGEKTVREGKQMLARQIYPEHQRWFLSGYELSDCDTLESDAIVCLLVEAPFEPCISKRDLARKRRLFIEEYADRGDIPQTVYWVDAVERDEFEAVDREDFEAVDLGEIEFVAHFIQKRGDNWSYFRGSGGLGFLDRLVNKVNLMGDEIADRICQLREMAEER